MANISLKYLTKYYQHQQIQTKLSHKVLNNTNKHKIMYTKYLGEVGGWIGSTMDWTIHEGCLMPLIVPVQRRDCMCETR
jgi:hypothetical protein